MNERLHHKLNGTAARLLALTMAGWTSAFVLFSPTSIASRVAGGSLPSEAINALILVVCVVGWADIIWHDVIGRLIWPSLSRRIRHQVCVATYSTLAGLTGLRAFVAAGSDAWEVHFLGTYYLTCAVGIGMVAVAIALDPHHGTR